MRHLRRFFRRRPVNLGAVGNLCGPNESSHPPRNGFPSRRPRGESSIAGGPIGAGRPAGPVTADPKLGCHAWVVSLTGRSVGRVQQRPRPGFLQAALPRPFVVVSREVSRINGWLRDDVARNRTGGRLTTGITVNSSCLNSQLLKGQSGACVFVQARLYDPIDAVIAHEFEEDQLGSHEAALEHG